MAKLSEEEKARRALRKRRQEALRAEQDAVRVEEKRREWDANGTRLTWDKYVAGVACRGCGLPASDGLGSRVPPLYMSAQEREDHAAADVEYQRRHGDCHAHRWSVEGSLVTHCGYCCPPLPIDPRRHDDIVDLFRRLWSKAPPAPEDLDTWRLTLTCGHVVDKAQHRTNTYWSIGVSTCPDCQHIRGIVTADRLPADEGRRRAEQQRLSQEIGQAERDRDRAQKKADTAARRMARLERELATLTAACSTD
ncbi:hypothetical protein ACFQ73_02105 [Amycolatopsis japonica]|uniref:hypothetical protein n=1 Tax=Amycolatopsis japonica TaxID=208439 RepID=UPI00366C4F8E